MPRHPKPNWSEQYGCYVFDHRRHRHYLRGIPREDVVAAYRRTAEILEEAADQERNLRIRSVRWLCEAYLAWNVGVNSRRTRRGHEAMLRRFCQFEHEGSRYGDRSASSITATDLGRVDKAWVAKGYAAGYRAQLFKSVLACWNWAARPEPDRVPERLLESNPLAGMRRPSRKGQVARHGTRDDLAAFLRAARRDINKDWPVATRGRCMACMAAKRDCGPCRRSHAASVQMLRDTLVLLRLIGETGCRPGEACSARWEDWQPDAGRDARTGHRWGILQVAHKNIRWTGDKRKVVVSPSLVRAIERIRGRAGRHEGYIFTHRRGRGAKGRGAVLSSAGEPWNTTSLNARLRRWRAGAAVPADFTPYALRHGYYSKAAPILGAELAGLLGGTSGGVVRRRYLHGRDAALIEAAQEARKKKP